MNIGSDLFTNQFQVADRTSELARLKRLQESVGKVGLDEEEKKKLLAACRGFEEVFLKELLGQMRKLSFGFGDRLSQAGSQIYWEMTDSALSRRLAEADTLGVGRFVYEGLMRELSRFGQQTDDRSGELGGTEIVG